jgi:integrase/recombinase XerC
MTVSLPIALPDPSLLPAPIHGLGNVADDWEAAEVWLQAIGSRPKKGSPQTVATYRHHIAKLRWYCEHVAFNTPSRWSMADVTAFFTFLGELPASALCAHDGIRFANQGEDGYTPFRCQPAASSRSDIQRCIHAMFRAWREVGYLSHNPMGFHGAGAQRKVNPRRSVSLDLYDLVLETMEAQDKVNFEQRQLYVRDRFVLVALRELGLRTTEFIKATMGAFQPLSDPKTRSTYWIMHVTEETAKGRVERRIPVTRVALDALIAYRKAFGPALAAAAGGPHAAAAVVPDQGQCDDGPGHPPAADDDAARVWRLASADLTSQPLCNREGTSGTGGGVSGFDW